MKTTLNGADSEFLFYEVKKKSFLRNAVYHHLVENTTSVFLDLHSFLVDLVDSPDSIAIFFSPL